MASGSIFLLHNSLYLYNNLSSENRQQFSRENLCPALKNIKVPFFILLLKHPFVYNTGQHYDILWNLYGRLLLKLFSIFNFFKRIIIYRLTLQSGTISPQVSQQQNTQQQRQQIKLNK